MGSNPTLTAINAAVSMVSTGDQPVIKGFGHRFCRGLCHKAAAG
ncbi:MAG: hypothetical protein AAF213_03950 [Pseudomonadota bacterium]